MTHNDFSRKALASLLRRAKSGDRAAFEELYRRTAQAQYFTIVGKVGAEHAADILQDVYLVASKNIQQIREDAVLGYLSATARNLCLQFAQKQAKVKRELPLSGEADEALEQSLLSNGATASAHTQADPASVVNAQDEVARLGELLRHELTDEERQMVLLRYYYQYKIDDIARETGTSRSTVKRTLDRALSKLRSKLSGLPMGAGLSALVTKATEASMAPGADAVRPSQSSWLDWGTKAVGVAAALVILAGVGLSVTSREPAATEAIPLHAPELQLAAEESGLAADDTQAPELVNVWLEGMTSLVQISDVSEVTRLWCIADDGEVFDGELHGTDNSMSTWKFELASGTYELHAQDTHGNESVGTITVDLEAPEV